MDKQFKAMCWMVATTLLNNHRMSLSSLTKEIQTIVGTTSDGIIGPKTLTAICKKLGIAYVANEKECIRNIQKKVGSTVDGIYGPNTANAILKAIKSGNSTSTPSVSGNSSKIVPGDHVIIDIGHANGTGARGNGLEEHAVNVIIGGKLKSLLENYGVKVTVLDFPELDNGAELNKIVKEANKIKDAKLLISLHSDCAASSSAKGGHVCYRSDASKSFARGVASKLATLLPGRAETVVYRGNLAILKVSSCPSILVEGGFISNPHDSDIQKNHPELIANAYFEGLIGK